MKRRNLLIIVLAMVCLVSLVLVACDKDKHEHEFSEKWSMDETYHWREATCEHTDEVADKAEHSYVNGLCSVCGRENVGLSWTNAEATSSSNEKVLPAVPAKAEKPSIQIHYYRANSADYKSWGFWLWSKTESGADGSVNSNDKVEPYSWPLNYQDDDGAVAIYTLEELGWVEGKDVLLGFIAKKQDSSWTKDTFSADRFWNLSAATMDSNNYYHLYIITGVEQTFDNKEDFLQEVQQLQYGLSAEFTSVNRIVITTSSPIKHVAIYEGETVLAEADTTTTKNVVYNFEKGKEMDFGKDYTVKVTFNAGNEQRQCAVSIMKLYDIDVFDTTYYYDGELGAIFSSSSTTFKVWSPVSTRIVLKLYTDGEKGEAWKTEEMTKGDKGVFSVTVNGNLATNYYTYTVYNASYPNGKEIVDPYARSAGVNGTRGQIVDFSATNPEGWGSVTPVDYDANELVVWETHVADVTSSETWTGTEANRKKFLGMIEKGTTYTEGTTTVSTGFDHIVELGVNAVQLVPIFDQANNEVDVEFNWGYNPLNYNVLEGAYSSDPTDGYARIREFKQLVQAFNGASINIIMDVVYNHVNAAEGSNFDVLMPGYYYRYTAAGAFSNGSGCGNETASDRNMFRKFMIDSVCFWAKEYKLGGFRFDLMGLHDIETMNELTAALKKINPSIVVYGEPWTGGNTTLPSADQAKQANANNFEGYGQFNDQMRDALIAGGLKAATDKAWATGGSGTTDIVNGLKGYTGSSIKDLYKTVNYVTCHDNYTLHDRIIATGQFGKAEDVFSGKITLTAEQEATIRQMAMLANSVVFTSNGVNFMLAGEEFLRSKAAGGAEGEDIHNSYKSSYKVNELDYSLKIANADMFANYQKLIAFKRMFVKDFELTSNDAVTAKYTAEATSNNLITVTITAKDGKVWKIVHANGGVEAGTTADFNGYTLYLNTLGGNVTLSANTSIQAYQTIIAYK
ncbi:MAG: type I pullulanase [Clostridiales bacterium]|nr:type I pullulanase [Clostridiales bacterium]